MLAVAPSALERAQEWRLARVAAPPLGLGAGNLDVEASAEVMAEELARHLRGAAFPERVTLVAETEYEALALRFAVARSAP